MARETCPAMLMITSSPAPDSASSVISVWRLSCHRPVTPAFCRTVVQAVLNEVMGRVGSLGRGFPKSEDVPLGPTLPEPAGVPGRVRFERSQFVHFSVLLMGIIGSHVDITSGFLRHQARGLEIARVCPTRRRAGDGQESNRPGAVRRGPSQHRGRPSRSGPPGCGACVAIVLGIDFRCQTEV
jgi:hypothetical protein